MIHPGIRFLTDTVKGLLSPLLFSIAEILGLMESEVLGLSFMGSVISFSLSPE